MTRCPPVVIREATVDDAAALLVIYRPYIEESSISFEVEVPSTAVFAERIAKALSKWSWLVAECDGKPVGYAYGTEHRAREAYAYSVETSAYVHQDYHRAGIARALYVALLERLKTLGFANAYAGITLPNEASVGFHRTLGFEPIGVFPRVGYKFGEWHDVAWLHRPIQMP